MLHDTEPKLETLIWRILLPILIGLLAFFAIRTVVQSFMVVDISMEPNLHEGQFLLVNKAAYWFGSPQRGDIIVFHKPDDPSSIFVKRVIALPGETVKVNDGQVYINGAQTPLAEPYVMDPGGPDYSNQVPAAEYFVLGDNRARSSDSRDWGPVPEGNIIGKAWLSIWPLSDWGFAPNYSPEAGGG